MPQYRYLAKTSDGKTHAGTMEVANRQEAVDSLYRKNLLIISLAEEPSAGGAKRAGLFEKRIVIDDLVIFSRQLATIVKAGIPLVGALDILGQQIEKESFRRVILEIRDKVEAGSSLSEAMTRYQAVFSDLYINMVRAGEASGMLDEILDRVAEYFEKTSALQKKVRSALIYPAVVTSIAIAITLLLLIKVIPVFKEIYSGFGADLPVPTKILIAVSEGLGAYFPVAVLVIVLAVIMFRRSLKTDRGRLAFDRWLLNLPTFGVLFKKVAVSKFTRTLSTLLKSGVAILSALEIVSKTSGNRAVQEALEKVRSSVREGENIADPLAKSKVFPPMVVRMVASGEKAGELEQMLTKIADFYEAQVDAAVNGLTSLIEPFIIVFLGLVIGTIVICMFLPIFKLTALMGG